MRVVAIREHGGPEVLEIVDRPTPGLLGAQVRVRVDSSGLNRADLLQRRGRYPVPPGEPADILGLEFSGTVEALGQECQLRSIGDRVMGILGGGGYAEYVVVPERATIRVPSAIGLTEAGAIPEVFFTAWDALVNQARLLSGESVLIHAVGSGVGTAALQLSRALGARTIGTSRTEEKVQAAKDMGLDVGIVADSAGHWVDDVRKATGGAGVEVILDLVGASYLGENLKVLGTEGRWIVVGVPSGAQGELDMRALMAKRGLMRGTVLRARPEEEKILLARRFERTVIPQFERGLLRPVIDRVYPVGSAAEAHRRMESNENFGKLLLHWGS